MASVCYASVRGEVIRVTALNNCCAAVDAPCGIVVTDGFVSVVVTQNVEAAQEITVKNAADRVCAYDPGCDSLKDLDVVITLCQVNPELLSVTTGQALVLNLDGDAVGTRISSDLGCNVRFALETWSNIAGSACVGTPPVPQYGYFLLPCLRGARITGDITIDGANAVSLELTAKTTVPSLWGVGPITSPAGGYFVAPTGALGVPGNLATAIGSADHMHMQITSVPPPSVDEEDCGCIPLAVA